MSGITFCIAMASALLFLHAEQYFDFALCAFVAFVSVIISEWGDY